MRRVNHWAMAITQFPYSSGQFYLVHWTHTLAIMRGKEQGEGDFAGIVLLQAMKSMLNSVHGGACCPVNKNNTKQEKIIDHNTQWVQFVLLGILLLVPFPHS